jgi:REP element-mobilizing transposase RayT
MSLFIIYQHFIFCRGTKKYYIRYQQQAETLQCNVSTENENNMTEKFQKKYRIPSSRLKNWDYGNNGAYFITICSRNKEHFFGEIMSVDDENEMQLNEIGKLADKFWAEIPKHFPFVELGNYIVMPNHVHGILIIDKTNVVDDVADRDVALQCLYRKRYKNHEHQRQKRTNGQNFTQTGNNCNHFTFL